MQQTFWLRSGLELLRLFTNLSAHQRAFSRLVKTTIFQIEADPVEFAREFSTVLKNPAGCSIVPKNEANLGLSLLEARS